MWGATPASSTNAWTRVSARHGKQSHSEPNTVDPTTPRGDEGVWKAFLPMRIGLCMAAFGFSSRALPYPTLMLSQIRQISVFGYFQDFSWHKLRTFNPESGVYSTHAQLLSLNTLSRAQTSRFTPKMWCTLWFHAYTYGFTCRLQMLFKTRLTWGCWGL